jgi:hypothetical protein
MTIRSGLACAPDTSDWRAPESLRNPCGKGLGWVHVMFRIVFVFAGIILMPAPKTLCQEQSALLVPLSSCDDFPRSFSAPLHKMEKICDRSTDLLRAEPSRGLITRDLHLSAAGDLQAAGGSSSNTRPQGKKPSRDHSYLIELTSANWHPLSNAEKFGLFSMDLLHWETHVSLVLDAGLSLATNDRPFLGRGGYGFIRRYGFNMADEANYTFFGAFLFPTLFHEDPRYIPMDHGTKRARIAYALSRVVLTRNDAGGTELNKSLVLGTIVSTAISSAYYAPVGGSTGAGIIFANAGISLASDAGFNLFKEYWPNVSRKLKLSLWLRNLIRSSIRDTIKVY